MLQITLYVQNGILELKYVLTNKFKKGHTLRSAPGVLAWSSCEIVRIIGGASISPSLSIELERCSLLWLQG